MLPSLYFNKMIFIFLSSLETGIKGAYVAKDGVVSSDSIYVHIDKTVVDQSTLEVMINSHLPKSIEDLDDSVLIELPHFQEGLTEKFLQGKYSEMYPVETVLHRFPFHVGKVLTKNADHQEYLEQKLGVSLEGKELDSIPDLKDETFYTEKYGTSPDSREIKSAA